MNFDKIAKNIGRNVELQPAAYYLDAMGRPLQDVTDDWVITAVTKERVEIHNPRTSVSTFLSKDHIHHFTSNPHRSTNDLEHGFLQLLVQLYIQAGHLTMQPCLRPGERLPPPPVVEIVDVWVDLMFPVSNIAQQLGIEFSLLAWARESRVPALTEIGAAQVVLLPDASGKLRRYKVRDSPETQVLVHRFPPK